MQYCIKQSSASRSKQAILPPLYSTGEATSGLLHPVLDHPVHERHGCTGDSPMQDYQDAERTGVSLL